MSVITAEDLLSDVEPWRSEPWRSFIEQHVVPIRDLAISVSKQFVGDASAEVARVTADVAKRVVNTTEKSVGKIEAIYEVPEDPIECLRQFVEACANIFLGVGDAGKYTLFAWTLRKMTKEYLDAMYPPLKEDEEKRKAVFELLGISEDEPLFIPTVRSPLAENLTLVGYPDYPSLCRVEEWGDYVTLSPLPARRPTLGGLLCRLVDCVVGTLARPGMLSGIELSADVVASYIGKCPAVPPTLSTVSRSWLTCDWKRAYLEFTEGGKFKVDRAWVIEGFGVKCYCYVYADRCESLQQETNLLSFMRLLMPSLITGRTELLLSADGRVAITIERK